MKAQQHLAKLLPVKDFNPARDGDAPVVQIEEKPEGQIVIDYYFPVYYLSPDIYGVKGEPLEFTQVNIPRTGFMAESGRPLLPSFGRFVQIPFNCGIEFSSKIHSKVKIDEPILVLPAQEEIVDDNGEEESTEEQPHFEYDKLDEYDEEFYSTRGLYPQQAVTATGPFEIDGYNALLIYVRPFQYDPAQRELWHNEKVTVTIRVTPLNDLNEDGTIPPVPSDSLEGFGNLFLNPQRGIERRLGLTSRLQLVTAPPPDAEHEFLIIYHDDFDEAARVLADWKKRRGLRTKIVSLQKIVEENVDLERKEIVDRIKKYIRNEVSKAASRLRYVLLLGDDNKIPGEYISPSPSGENITDYYYSTQKDPVGPNKDKAVIVPWLALGRIPVQERKHAKAIVNQIIEYEKNPPHNYEYNNHLALASHFEDTSSPQDGKADRAFLKSTHSIYEKLIARDLEIETIYVSDAPNPESFIDDSPVPDEVKKKITPKNEATALLGEIISQGRSIIAYRGHGNSRGWTGPSFNRTDLDSIAANIIKPSIFFNICCTAGSFAGEEWEQDNYDSFAEKLLKVGKVPSLIAASRKSQHWLNNELMKALFDAMWGGVIETFVPTTYSVRLKYGRMGDMLNYAKVYLMTRKDSCPEEQKPTLQNEPVNKWIKDHFEIYHVLGDPTLEVWQTNPQTIGLKVKLTGRQLSITLVDRKGKMLSSCPMNSVITVWFNERMIKRIEPTSPHLTLSLNLSDIQELEEPELDTVCFWAPDWGFCESPRVLLS